MNSFFTGFEKRAYGYNYEARMREQYAQRRQHDDPVPYSKAIGITSALGAGLGGIIGSGAGVARALATRKLRPLYSSALGGTIGGAAGGALIGAAGAVLDRGDIAEQKEIMSMSPWERKDYLKFQSRLADKGLSQRHKEMRQQELIDEIKNMRY